MSTQQDKVWTVVECEQRTRRLTQGERNDIRLGVASREMSRAVAAQRFKVSLYAIHCIVRRIGIVNGGQVRQ